MAVVNVRSPAGKSYQFDISGAMPTPEEQAWIDQYVAQQEAPTSTEPVDGGGFVNAVGMGADSLQQAFGSALEGAGRYMDLPSVADYGRSVADFNRQQVEEAARGMTQWDDAEGIGGVATYAAEQIGQQVPNYGSTLAARLAGGYAGAKLGALAGAPFGGAGAVPGAIIGGALGAYGAPYLVNTAQMYGMNRERQREVDAEAGRDVSVDEGAALSSALRQGAVDTAGELIPFAKFLPKPLANFMTSGGVAQRIAKGIGVTVAAEVPIEVYQQVEERYQAGLPLDDEEAMAEYEEIARATAFSAGAIGGVSNAFNPDSKKTLEAEEAARKQRELLEDQADDVSYIRDALAFGEAASGQTTGELVGGVEPAPELLGLPAPDQNAPPPPPAAGSTPAPAEQPSAKPKPFRWQQYQAAVSQAVSGGKVTIPVIQQAAKLSDADTVTPEVARAIRDEMVAQGVVKQEGNAFSVKPEATAGVDTVESYRRTLEDLNAQEQASLQAYRRAMLDSNREAQLGSKEKARDFQREADKHAADVNAARRTRVEVEGRMANQQKLGSAPSREAVSNQGNRQQAVEFADASREAQEKATADRVERMANSLSMREQQAAQMEQQIAELQRADKKVQLPNSEKARLASLKGQLDAAKKEIAALRGKMRNPQAAVEKAQAAQQARAAEQAAAQQAQAAARQARRAEMTPTFTAKQAEVFRNLRERLNKLNLKDVRLTGEQMINPEDRQEGDLIEGTFDLDPDQKAVIALSMGIYDPNLTEDQLFQRLASVMNHEIIHALKAMGLLTDAEWKTLVEVAKRQNYVKNKDGKDTKRSYTYFERAASMYRGQSEMIIEEEAVAEIFRDWLNGRVKVGGKPRSLMQKIKDLFRSIWGSNADAGVTSLDQIFSDIESGKIGARDRTVTTAAAMDPNLVVDIDGSPRLTEAESVRRRSVHTLLANEIRGAEKGFKGFIDIPGSPVFEGKMKDFGRIWEGDTPIRVVFPNGDHSYENKAGIGMAHISARNHDKELYQMSKYKSVSQAVKDILYRWERETAAQGGNVIGYPYDGNITLEWRHNRSHSAPPLALVLSRHRALNAEGKVQDFYAVKTFYPITEKNEKLYKGPGRKSLLRGPNEVYVNGISVAPKANDPVWVTQAGIPVSVEGEDGDALRASAKRFAARSIYGNPEFGQLTPDDLDNLTPEFFDKPGWSILTATSDRDWQEERFREGANQKAHRDLVAELNYRGIPYRVVEGMYEGVPDGISYLILADEPTARQLGARYDQDSVLTNRGFIYSKAVAPRTARKEGIFYGDEAKAQPFWTDLGDGRAFSLEMDEENTGPAVADIGIGFYTIDSRPQLPIRRSDGKVELHHWSGKKLKTVDPKFAGTGPLNGVERRRGAMLGFFGINPRPDQLAQGTGYVKEKGLGKREHIALVDPKDLYPWFTDPDGLAVGLNPKSDDFENQYEDRIKAAGYKGYYTERLSGTMPTFGKVKPWSAPLGNVAAMFEPVPVKPVEEVQLGLRNPTRYSIRRGMTRPLTRAETKLTVLGRMDDRNDFRFISDGKKRTVLEAAQELLNGRGGVVIEESDPDFVVRVARLMLAEARAALIRNPGAIGWYGDKVALSKRLAAMLHPEISPVNPYSGAKSNSYDPDAEHAWDYAMAVTSNGMAVLQNAKEANKQYEYWKENGRFKEQGVGKQGVGMVAAFKFYNAMKDAGYTDAQIAEFLSRRTTPKALESDPIIQQLGMNISTKEGKNVEVYGSYLIGPKIGNGFYQNLRGNFDPLTMDLWFMRMFNRLTGKPFVAIKDELLQKNAQRVMEEFKNRDQWTQYERDTARAVLDDMAIDFITEENAADFAIKYDEVFQRDFKKMSDDAIKASGRDKKSDRAKEIGAAARPVTGNLTLATKRLRENASMTLGDTPSGSRQRALMREIVNEVRSVLASEGNTISTADFQALMWYAEKQLLASMGVRGGNGGDNDYVDGAIELLRSRGIEDAEIERGLPDTERDRLSHGTDAKRTAARVRDGSANAVEGGSGTEGVPGAPVGGGQAQAGSNGRKGSKRNSMMSLRMSVSPTAAQVQRAEKALMYARSADLIAKVLNLKGYGLKKNAAQKFADGVLRRFQDNMLPVGRMIQELSAKGMTITDAMDTYLQEELMHGRVGYKIGRNQDELFKPTVEAVKKISVGKQQIDDLIKVTDATSGKPSNRGFVSVAMEDTDSPRMVLADAYLYALHAKERNAYILANKDKNTDTGSGMSDAEADAILNWVARLDPENRAAFSAVRDGVRAVVANTNRERVESGLISQDVVDQNPYQNYVPLRGFADNDDPRAEDADDTRGPPSRPRFGARGREDKKALGRAGYADGMLANAFTQNQNAILRGERNKVGQSFVALLRANPSATAGYARVLPTHPKMRVEGPNGQPMMVNDPTAYNDPHMLVVKVGGKETWVEFDDARLAGALNGRNAMAPGVGAPLIKAMSTVNRYLANINTSYNPEFIIANMLRDLQTAGVNVGQFEKDGLTKAVIGSVPSAIRGIKRVIRNNDESSEWSKVYKDFVANGGQNATNQFNSLADEMDGIRKMLGDISDAGVHGRINKVRHGFLGKGAGSLLRLVEDYNTIAENGVRVATYKALLDSGFTPERAAQAARNVTVNFAKGGDLRQFMGAWYLFYNASIQGSFALLNAAVRSGRVRKMWMSAVAVGLIMDQLNAMMSDDDDDDGKKDYDGIDQYVLEHNMIIPDIFGITDRSYFSIPMPYGLNMAYNAGRAMSRAARGGYDAGEATSTIFGTAIDALNPIGGLESWANFVAPTVADPFIDLVENSNYRGSPIFKENMPFDKTPLPNSQLYWQTTSTVARTVADQLNSLTGGNAVRPGIVDINPDVMEFWFEFLTGGVGRFVQRSAELPFRVADEGLTDELISNVPFLRKTVGSTSTREDQTAYIESAGRVLMAAEELKKARESGDVQWARDTVSRYQNELRLVGLVRNTEAALKKISQQRNQIISSARLTEEEKRPMLKALDDRKETLIQRANGVLAGLE